MNTCEKNDHYYYFLFIQQYRTSYSEGTATPLTLVTFAKKIHFLSFSNILDFLEFFHIFLTIFPNRTATPLRSAATLRIARYVAFWRQAATPAATAIFIFVWSIVKWVRTELRV